VSACDGPLTIMTDRILAAKVGQAFLPAGRPPPHAPSDSSPSQNGGTPQRAPRNLFAYRFAFFTFGGTGGGGANVMITISSRA